MNRLFALIWNFSWSTILVGSLYIWPYLGVNNAMLSTPKKRMISMLVVTFLCFYLTPATMEQMGFVTSIQANLFGILLPMLMTVSLFLGPLVYLYMNLTDSDIPRLNFETFKTIIYAPLCEEIMFRSSFLSMMMMYGYSKSESIWITPLFFGIGMSRFRYKLFSRLLLTFEEISPLTSCIC